MTVDARPTAADPDDDPHLWLEDINGQAALAWVEAQNQRTLARLGGERFAADQEAIVAILDHPAHVPSIVRRGSHLYSLLIDGEHPRGLWRRTTLASYRREAPQWEAMVDVDALAAREGEDWTWYGAETRPGTHDRAIIYLSRGGGDATALREFDMVRKEFVAGGFELPEAKGFVLWRDPDTLWLCSAWDGNVTPSGYARTIRLWRRGTDPLLAPVLFEGSDTCEFIGMGVNFWKSSILLQESGLHFWMADSNGENRVPLDVPAGAQFDAERGWLAIMRTLPWSVGGETHPAGTLLGMRQEAFLGGKRDFTVLFRPEKRRSLSSFGWVAGRLILEIFDNLQPVFECLTPSDGDGGWSRERLAGLPEIGLVQIGRLDDARSDSNGDLAATVQSPLVPPSLLLLPAGAAAPTLLKRSPAQFTTDGLVVTRHEAVSTDGERIPYWQTGPAGETGDAPVHLTGYGGFGDITLPSYDPIKGKLWLERGGTSVLAHIRGGGEFGLPWHEAGRFAGKSQSHDDFAAVAADLVRRGVTRPQRIAAQGGSNGGLLIANMLTRYPERFGALYCHIPLIDMRRFSKLLAGANWINEYGDPDVPEHWAWLKTYSAYHQVVPGRAYPPLLIATNRRDDRVHPGHARKMAAKLQAMGYEDVWLYEAETGGHDYSNDTKTTAAFNALGYAFLWERIGFSEKIGGQQGR